jgi:peptidoglycan/LPS O-acetylase OafA/YrhL
MALWGIFFPMGIVFSLQEGPVKVAVQRALPVLGVISAGLYILTILDVLAVVDAPLAGFLLPVTVLPLIMLVQRDRVPAAGMLEKLGRNAYALYLTNLLLISVVLSGALAMTPSLYSVPIMLAALAGAVAIVLPSLAAAALARSPRPKLRLYVFG